MLRSENRAAVATEVSLVLAATFWGLNFAATKYATATIPPLLLVALRFTVGGLLLLLVLRIFEPKSKLARRDLLPMAALGCLGVATAQTGFTFGVSLSSAGSTGLIFATAPVWGLLLGAVLGLERPSWKGVIGVGLSIVGVALVVLDGLTSGNASLVGDLLVLIAAVCVGAYAVLSMPLLERHTPLAVATYPVLFGIPFLLLLSSPAWQRGISRIGANRVLVYQYLITVVAVTSGIVFFGETLGANKIAGGMVILLGVYLARRQ